MNNYPTKKVMIGYILFGVLTSPVMALIFVATTVGGPVRLVSSDKAGLLFIASVAVGMLSAFLTGFYLARTKTCIRHIRDVTSGIVGVIATFLPYFCYYLLSMGQILINQGLSF